MSETVIKFEIDSVAIEALEAMFLEDVSWADIKDHQVFVYSIDQDIERGTPIRAVFLTTPIDLLIGDEMAVSALGIVLAVRRGGEVIYEMPGLHSEGGK